MERVWNPPPAAEHAVPGPSPTPRRAGHRLRRLVWWAALLAAVTAVLGGGYVAYSDHRRTDRPESTVLAYFAALRDGDAPAALAFGDIPSGSRALLTPQTLDAQLLAAPAGPVTVLSVAQTGATARVTLRYELRFADRTEAVTDTVALRRDGRTWALAAVAIPVQLSIAQAANRASAGGAAVPTGTVLVFPGALPIRFDTANLALAPGSRVARFDSPGRTAVRVTISPAGERALASAVTSAVTSCLSAPKPSCPRPVAADRIIPGSLKGTASSDIGAAVDATLDGGPDGRIDLRGELDVQASYRSLDFENQPVNRSGKQTLRLTGYCYATAVDDIVWVAS